MRQSRTRIKERFEILIQDAELLSRSDQPFTLGTGEDGGVAVGPRNGYTSDLCFPRAQDDKFLAIDIKQRDVTLRPDRHH